jgi:hypothetical protein
MRGMEEFVCEAVMALSLGLEDDASPSAAAVLDGDAAPPANNLNALLTVLPTEFSVLAKNSASSVSRTAGRVNRNGHAYFVSRKQFSAAGDPISGRWQRRPRSIRVL